MHKKKGPKAIELNSLEATYRSESPKAPLLVNCTLN